MNIFVDAGCYNGDTIRSLLGYEPLMKWRFDLIIGFDISPRFDKSWGAVRADYRDREIYFYQEAVWTKNDEIEVAILPEGKEEGNTVMSQKDKWKVPTAEKIKVKSFDFSHWLKKYKDDNVIVKMDIEGAEYPVLNKMIEDGTDSIPNTMLIEFHWAKMRDHDERQTEALIKKLNTRVVRWL